IERAILTLAAAAALAGAARATAPDTVWTSRQGFPVARDCRVNAAAADAQGNLYLAGSIDNGANEDFYVCRIDAATDSIVWSDVYNGPADDLDQATGCCLDSSGNLYVTGFSHNSTDFDVLTIKYDAATGARGWVRRIDAGNGTNECASSCAIDRSGGFYIVGSYNKDSLFSHMDHQPYEAYVVKCDGANGDTIWTRRYFYPPDTSSEAIDCCVDSFGNLFVVGYTQPAAFTSRAMAMRLDPMNGDTIWTRYHTPAGCASAACCCIDTGGDLIMVSTTFSGTTFATVIKYRAVNGDTTWSKVSGVLNDPQDCVSAADAVIISSNTWWGSNYNIQSIGIDSGNAQWSRTCPMASNNRMVPLAQCGAGAFYVASTHATGDINTPTTLWGGVYTARHSIATGDLIDSTSRGQSMPGRWDFAYDCAAGGDGPVIAASAGGSYAVQKLDPENGHVVWQRQDLDAYDQFNERNAKATSIAINGAEVYTTGNIGSTGLMTCRYDLSTGDTIWAVRRAYGLSYATDAVCSVDPWGDLFVAGHDGAEQFWWPEPIAIKLSKANGDTIWTQRQPAWFSVSDCAVAGTGDLCLLGQSFDACSILIKYDNGTGDTVWTNVPFTDVILQGVAIYGGFLYVAGYVYNGSDLDFFLACCDSASGDSLWTRRFDSPYHGDDRAAACEVDDAGYIYLSGSSHNGADLDIWTIKCAANGDTLWSVRYDGPNGKDDLGRACCTDSLGNLYVTGITATGWGYEMVTIKYNTGHLGLSGNGPAAPGYAFYLGQPYPNPCHDGRVTLQYAMSVPGHVRISVYNIAGQRVRTIENDFVNAGTHKVCWNGANDDNQKAANGVYIIRGYYGDACATRNVVVAR
ncbi:MAG: hypothetical protein EG825_13605, partial [Rhodocyclaceae bacterium]|nr:hypothetical protein [Rhodocyclaceae bacterium]